MSRRFSSLRGTHDILPGETERWQFVERTAQDVFGRYGFREIRTPLLEATELFARSVGSSTDIVRKEMYTFERGDDSVSLRPEGTASVVRSFVQHSRARELALGYPERLYYVGPMFRYERPQKGRQRQFHQIGVELLGAAEPLGDAETLEMLWSFLSALGIEGIELSLNSVGDDACRPVYRTALKEWLAPRLEELCSDCGRRFEENPLRVLDCKVEHDRELLAEAPLPLDHLCEPCRDHFDAVQEALRELAVPFAVDPRIVRGLDYYERTVFEVTSDALGAQNAVLGGGRYDGLSEALGGPAVPGFGFAIGLERLLLLVPRDRGRAAAPDAALVALGPAGLRGAVALAQRLRAAGLSVLLPLSERPLGAQLKRADKQGARFAVFVGADELGRGRFGVKDLAGGEQEELSEAALIERLGGTPRGE